MRRWLSLPRAADAWNAAQRTRERCAQPRYGAWHLPSRGVSTAALRLHDLEYDSMAASTSASASAEHNSASGAAGEILSAIAQRITLWLAAPKRKVQIFQSPAHALQHLLLFESHNLHKPFARNTGRCRSTDIHDLDTVRR